MATAPKTHEDAEKEQYEDIDDEETPLPRTSYQVKSGQGRSPLSKQTPLTLETITCTTLPSPKSSGDWLIASASRTEDEYRRRGEPSDYQPSSDLPTCWIWLKQLMDSC
jgi:hypothetical protein